MSQDTKNLLIPIIGIAVGVIIYIAILLLFAFDLQTGTAAEWVGTLGAILVGLVAAAFAALAWRESQRATRATEQATVWARIAAEAQNRSNALTEAKLVPTIVAALRDGVTAFGEKVPAVSIITIELSEDSPAPIWIRSFSSDLAILHDAKLTSSWHVTDHDTHNPFDGELPSKLMPGSSLAEPDPYHHLYGDRHLSIESLILYDLAYSFTENGPLHVLERQTVNLDDKANIPAL